MSNCFLLPAFLKKENAHPDGLMKSFEVFSKAGPVVIRFLFPLFEFLFLLKYRLKHQHKSLTTVLLSFKIILY